ncbi:MAG TPA: alpha/beta hydrolase [Bryobacteraceae bacterium]|nr:alpha/beta hydrolase [Bryobacteraceae bacterium]
MAEEQLGFIHRFVPAAESGPRPTLLLLHGTGGNEEDLLPLGSELYPGAALLSPRGKVLEQGMPRFFRRLSEGVFDLADLRARAHELADFLARAMAHYGLDPARVWAAGFSNGANIAAALLLLRPEALAGAVLLRAMVPLVPDPLPDLAGKQVWMSSGRRDPIAIPEQAEALSGMLRACGAGVTLNWVAGGHALQSAELEGARAWLSGAAR